MTARYVPTNRREPKMDKQTIGRWYKDITSEAFQDVLFPGASIQSALNDKNVTTNNCGTGGSTGTSMTAPAVSGLALLFGSMIALAMNVIGRGRPEAASCSFRVAIF